MGLLSPSNLNHVQVWHLNVSENRLTSLLLRMLSTATHALRNLSDNQVFYGIKHCILPLAERSLCSRLARNRAAGTCPPTWIGRCGESTVAEISGFCSKGYPVCFDLLTQWVACVPVKWTKRLSLLQLFWCNMQIEAPVIFKSIRSGKNC